MSKRVKIEVTEWAERPHGQGATIEGVAVVTFRREDGVVREPHPLRLFDVIRIDESGAHPVAHCADGSVVELVKVTA